MLEVSIIDSLDQLVARYPRFDVSNQTSKILYDSDATVVGSLGETIMLMKNYWQCAFSPDNTKIYAASRNTSQAPYKSLLIDLTAETVAFDDSVGRGLYPIVPDQSGVVWASGNRSGYYGIWKRTGAATWTNMLSDAAAGQLNFKPDGTLYYMSSTNNWYLLANGAATLVGAPVGYYAIPNTQYLEFPNAEGRINNNFADATGTVIPALGAIDMSVVTQSSGWYYPVTSLPTRQMRIDNTYALLAWQPVVLPTNALAPKVYLYLVNKVTQTQKYIGVIPCPTLSYGAAMNSQSSFDIAPIFAKLESGFLKIYWLGVIAQNGSYSSTTNRFGLIRTNVPYIADI